MANIALVTQDTIDFHPKTEQGMFQYLLATVPGAQGRPLSIRAYGSYMQVAGATTRAAHGHVLVLYTISGERYMAILPESFIVD